MLISSPISYQTPSGVVSGIQWIPADPATIPPPGAQIVPGLSNDAARNIFTDTCICRILATGKVLVIRKHPMIGEDLLLKWQCAF